MASPSIEHSAKLVFAAIHGLAGMNEPLTAEIVEFARDPLVMDTVLPDQPHSARFEAAAYGLFHLGVTSDNVRSLHSQLKYNTPLKLACFLGIYDAVVGLVNLGADIHDVGGSGTALQIALHTRYDSNRERIVAFLLERGADWRGLLNDVAVSGNVEIMRCIVDPLCTHRVNQRGPLSDPLPPPDPLDLDEPLYFVFASQKNTREMTALLAPAGASVRTALRRWFSENPDSIVKFLGFLNKFEDVTDLVRSIADQL